MVLSIFHVPVGSHGVGNGNPLQYSCLENSVDRRAWQTIVHAVAELDMTEYMAHTFVVSLQGENGSQ